MGRVGVVILAGGSGTRLHADTPKQYHKLAGRVVLEYTVSAFRQALPDAEIVVVSSSQWHDANLARFKSDPLISIAIGGGTRQESCLAGLKQLESGEKPDIVLIHDASRPFVGVDIIRDVLVALQSYEAVDVAIPTTDTIVVEKDGCILSIPDRKHVFRGQTPQGFNFEKLLAAYQSVGLTRLRDFSDDCGIFRAAYPDIAIRIVEGSHDNIKITHPIDLVLADELIRLRNFDGVIGCAPIDLSGKRAIVFGGSRGIGRAICDVLRNEGCEAHSFSRSTGCDVERFNVVERTIAQVREKCGTIDYVVNCAGQLFKSAISSQHIDEINSMVSTNLIGAINISKASFDCLSESRGMLLHVASSAYTRGRAEYAPYSATKAAVVNLAQGLADEWSDFGVRVNCLVPSRTKTEMRTRAFGPEEARGMTNPYLVAVSACQLLSSSETGLMARV
jgi:2-C-methyl-D-erythritol 4-phosphate cytidylyltransferase